MRKFKAIALCVVGVAFFVCGTALLSLPNGPGQAASRPPADKTPANRDAALLAEQGPPGGQGPSSGQTSPDVANKFSAERGGFKASDVVQGSDGVGAKVAVERAESVLKASSLKGGQVDKGASDAQIDKLLSMLATDFSKLDPSGKAELLGQIKELASALGDEAVVAVMNRFDREDAGFGFRHEAVVALQAIGTANAYQALQDISMGKTETRETSLREWAAGALVSGLGKAEEGTVLLDADLPGVQNVGLHFLAGRALNDQAASRVANLAKSDNQAVRWSAATVMGKDPAATHATLYISALNDAIATAHERADANKTYPRHYFTYAEMDTFRYIEALSQMPSSALAQALQKASGVSSQALGIAMARQGGAAGSSVVHATLQDSSAGLWRLWAAQAMGRIGTEADLPLLESVAKTDSLVRRDASSMRAAGQTGEVYPVREAARDAISQIKSRGN